MAIKAWVHCVGPDRDGTEKEIVSFLAENGVEIRNFDPYVIRDYGVLLFGEFSVELCDFLREASPGCRERILAGRQPFTPPLTSLNLTGQDRDREPC